MRRLFVAAAAAVVLACAVFGLFVVTRALQQQAAARRFLAAGPANLAREQAAARQAGIPLDVRQLQQPLPPPGQNAAPLYTNLTALLHDKPLNLPKYAEGMDAFHTYTPAQVAAVRKILAERQDVMTLVHQAADRPKCVFVRDWSKGIKLEFPEYMPMREAARLIKTESYLLALDGHYKEAVVNQARGFRVAQHAASDHLLLAYLVGVACEGLTLSGMQSILALEGPNADVDADVGQTVAARHSRLSLRDAMAGEAGFGCIAFPQMHSAEGEGIDAVLTAGGFSDDEKQKVQFSAEQRKRLHDLIDAWEADYLARMFPLVVTGDQPPPARRAAYEAVNKQVKRDADDFAGGTHLFTTLLLPAFTGIDENETRRLAREEVTRAAAAILAQKAKTGTYPDKLPQEFKDPFTNKPLNYRREGNSGFVVYSAGPTGHFDGGQPGRKVDGHESLFRYPVVPAPQ